MRTKSKPQQQQQQRWFRVYWDRAGKNYMLQETGWDREQVTAGADGLAEPYTFPSFFTV